MIFDMNARLLRIYKYCYSNIGVIYAKGLQGLRNHRVLIYSPVTVQRPSFESLDHLIQWYNVLKTVWYQIIDLLLLRKVWFIWLQRIWAIFSYNYQATNPPFYLYHSEYAIYCLSTPSCTKVVYRKNLQSWTNLHIWRFCTYASRKYNFTCPASPFHIQCWKLVPAISPAFQHCIAWEGEG